MNKDIPKKVIFKTVTLNDRDFYISRCPNCKCYLDANKVDKYCSECGQKLDWENAEDEKI